MRSWCKEREDSNRRTDEQMNKEQRKEGENRTTEEQGINEQKKCVKHIKPNLPLTAA
jgi:hypothetical protein